MKLWPLIFFCSVASAQSVSSSFIIGGAAAGGGGGGGSCYSDDMSTNPATRWTTAWGSWLWSGGSYRTQSTGGYTIYNSSVGSATQYMRAYINNQPSGGLIFRSTGTASDGFYVCVPYGGNLIISRGDDTGFLEDITSASFSFSAGHYWGVTVTGTGTSTTFKAWYDPTSATPHDVSNWDSASDPADATITLTEWGGTVHNTGQYVGMGVDAAEVWYSNISMGAVGCTP